MCEKDYTRCPREKETEIQIKNSWTRLTLFVGTLHLFYLFVCSLLNDTKFCHILSQMTEHNLIKEIVSDVHLHHY